MGVNRSSYYKHYNSEPADRTKENQEIAKMILQIYAYYNKRLGAYKITYVLKRDYGINISVGRVYRNALDRISEGRKAVEGADKAIVEQVFNRKFTHRASDNKPCSASRASASITGCVRDSSYACEPGPLLL